jgi:iron complex outermembrane receptor protein
MLKAIDFFVVAVLCSAVSLWFPQAASAEEGDDSLAMADALGDLSLEELLNVEVYSVSKKKQKLSDSAAAVYVLSQEDIERSGATTIMDALRLVPGVEVANVNRNTYSISVRGFSDRFANKLLVMIDGRSVYTPLFAGVYWDVQDTMLEDVARIEVVRGPGGTVWGANAVNGVINIITKSAKETQGTLATALMGNEEKGTYTLRQGTTIGPNGHIRFYGKYFDRDSYDNDTGGSGQDQWRNGRAGFRADWDFDDDDVTVQGEYYSGKSFLESQEPLLDPPYLTPPYRSENDFAGGHLLTRWDHDHGDGEQTEVQVYIDHTDRQADGFNTYHTTFDAEFQHNLPIFEDHELILGLNYRLIDDDSRQSFAFSLTPDSRTTHLYSGFVQAEFRLLDDSLRTTVGTKLEHNDHTGFEFQPSGRFLWKPADNQTFWGAASRAVRTPSRAEDDIRINSQVVPPGFPPNAGPIPLLLALTGSRSFDSEELISFELGWRTDVSDRLSIDLATFYNIYDDLRSLVPDFAGIAPEFDPLPVHTTLFFDLGNASDATTYGAELAADLVLTEDWRLRAGYTYINMDVDDPPGAVETGIDDASAKNRMFLRSLSTLPGGVEFDMNLRYVDSLDTEVSGTSTNVDSYVTADVRLAYKLTDSLEFSFVGLNLFEDDHKEFGPSVFAPGSPTNVERSFYGKVTLRR